MFHIYVVVDEETKEDVFRELSAKYDVVEEQSRRNTASAYKDETNTSGKEVQGSLQL
ncbi:hypothetical protein CHS0354_027454 [Potamilus streckersoni]|uniref:Uncharacterized protein n=1 Tax=Potamilus streckersoni TaxID=2493646 RepID=A0AAE0T6K5_9BIVA|nr:hypothetical protein CHS0354_027454 [Potamilus streckersoni]